jgi:uncharacterized protein
LQDTQDNHPLIFTLLVKPSGAACNLACQYCFYLEKEQLYPGSSLRMPDGVLKAYIKQFLHAQPAGEVNLAWQGGEPTLMGIEFFQRATELAKIYQKPGQVVTYSLQTNGTLLDETWGEFLHKHGFLVGISMDGCPENHNAFRVNKGGQATFDLVKRGWDVLQKHQVDTNILCAVHSANAPHALETYRYFRDELQATYIQFIPIVERLPGTPEPAKQTGDGQAMGHVSLRSVKPEQFGAFLVEIFDEWVRHDVGKVFVQNFEAALAAWCHLPASVCTFQEVCGRSLVLEHNGDLYSCDHFVTPKHRLGNILETPMVELVRSAQQRQFGLAKRQRLSAFCQKCEYLFACRGECPRNRFTTTLPGQGDLNYLCPSYKLFFKHIDRPMHLIAELVYQGRDAEEIMQAR